jgi:hypothetical protein
MWMASGLLSVIMLAVPIDAARMLYGASNPFAGDGGLLEPWVYGVVYGGFLVEGLGLLGAFAMYAVDRHGRLMDARIRAYARRLPPAARSAAALAAGLLVAAGVARLAWACGADFGLTAQRGAEMDATARIVQAVQSTLALAAAAALSLLARGRSTMKMRLPLAVAWVGSAAAFSWGGFVSVTGAISHADHRPSAFMAAIYTAESAAGLLALGAGWWGMRSASGALVVQEVTGTVLSPTAKTAFN